MFCRVSRVRKQTIARRRSQSSHSVSSCVESLEPRLPLDSTTVINELMYAPSSDAPEWIELHNQQAVDMDLSGWSLANGIEYLFPDGTVIEGGGFLVVASRPESLSRVEALGPFRGRLSNGGEQVELRNNNARLMSVVDYRDDGDWPVGADGSGASLAKLDESLATEPASSWRTSVRIGGTPGAENFPAIAKEESSAIQFDSEWRYHDTGVDLGNAWREVDFPDAAWSVGQGLFWDGAEMLPLVRQTPLRPEQSTYYFRTSFDYQPGDRTPSDVLVNLIVEDGAAIYLNGTEVSRVNLPEGPVSFSTPALVELELARSDEPILLPLELLRVGNNVLAVEVHQASTLFDVEVKNASFEANVNGPLFAPTDWDGAGFLFNGFTRVTQLDSADAPQTHLPYPDGSQAIVMRSDDGETMEIFQDVGTIAPGTYTLHYAVADRLDSQWLNYSVELLAVDESGETILTSAASTDDAGLRPANGSDSHPHSGVPAANEGDWREISLQASATADHAGKTLRLRIATAEPSAGDSGEHNEFALDDVRMTVDLSLVQDVAFGLSLDVVEVLPPPPELRFNEIAGANDETFFVELFNPSAESVDLSDVQVWFGNTKRSLPQQELRPGGVLTLGANTLDVTASEGDQVFLVDASNSVLDARTVDRVGRGVHAASNQWLVVALPTPDAENHFELLDSVVINEVMYHAAPIRLVPPAIAGESYEENPLEWIEIYNAGDEAVDLTGWQLTDAVTYEFAPGTTLPADGYLIVTNDVASMAAEYPLLTNVVGGFNGSLSNRGERILLLDEVGNPADEVGYFDDGGWDGNADGFGPSLELIDARADNAIGNVWRASDEASKSEWRTYTYRGIPERTIPGEPTVWREFVFGFLDGAGEALIDDISVVEDPDGAALQLIQNGAFDNNADHFRLLGNHQRSAVIDDQGNPVLHLVSSGAAEYQGNQIETTFADNRRLQRNTEYEVSFRAKWLSGVSQINSRFYFNQLPKTTALLTPTQNGTPGRQNSRVQSNAGPTVDQLQSDPVMPAPGEAIRVFADVADPDGVADVALWYRVDGEPWSSLTMTNEEAGSRYAAVLPGQDAGVVIQYYVEATDSRQASAVYPNRGPDSRALLQVDDGRGENADLTPFRLVMLQADVDQLHSSTNVLSNERLGGTVVSGDKVYHDIGVRLKGSFVGRDAVRVGFNIAFNPDNLFRGVHDKVSVDRSTHANLGVDEILLKHTANRAGGIPSMYDDLIDFVAPRDVNTGTSALRMAGFDEVYLDSQYENGSDGTMYEYEVLRWATTTVDGDPESLKRAGGLGAPNGFANVEIQDLGDDKEAYRWTNLILSNRKRDDYDSIIAMGKAFEQTGDALFEQTQEVLDVDQWMRTAALQSLFQPADSYFTGSNLHNFRIYVRPDGKVQYMPWDWDSAFQGSFRAPLVGGSKLGQIVRLPQNLRAYYGHMLDIVDRGFNREYLADWTDHYGELAGQRFTSRLSYVDRRATFVVEQISEEFPPVAFAVSTPTGQRVDDIVTTVEGTGWVDIRELRLAETGEPLKVEWLGSPNADRWRIRLPLDVGRNQYTFEARDFRGNLVGSETIEIESTVSSRPLRDFLRITEINYNPDGDDGTEFIEFANVSSGAAATPLDLSGVTISDGPSSPFVIADSVALQAGEFLLVVKDKNAFQSMYPSVDESLILGEFVGSLANSGERIRVVDAEGSTLLDLTYSDGDSWPQRADGVGGTLVLSRPGATRALQVEDAKQWRGSTEFGGSPGSASAEPIGIVINEVLANTNSPQSPLESIELFNTTSQPIDLGGWFLSDSAAEFEKYRIPSATVIQPGAYLVIEESAYNPTPDSPSPGHFGLSGTNGDDLWLVSNIENGRRQFVADVHFGSSIPGESLSWFGTPGTLLRTQPTIGLPNDTPLVDALIVTEINYAPAAPTAAALAIDAGLDESDLEFVELYNRSAAPVSLLGVQIRAGIEFEFDVSADLAPAEVLVVVSFDPASEINRLRSEAFRRHYDLDEDVRLVGGFRNRLSDTGDRVLLTRPGQPFGIDDYVVEEIAYDDELPWPMLTGLPGSLQRVSDQSSGAFAASWNLQAPTPGQIVFDGVKPGDFNGDGAIDVRDIDRLWTELRLAVADPAFDLTGDQQVDQQDRDRMIDVIVGTSYGDADLNRRFDSADFVLVFRVGEYEDAIVGNSTWQEGDWNADGDFTTADLVLAFQSGMYVANAERNDVGVPAVDEVFAQRSGKSRPFVV